MPNIVHKSTCREATGTLACAAAMPHPPVIDRNLIQHLAELARLHIPAERQPELRARLERIIAAFSALDPSAAAATARQAAAMPAPLGLRADRPEPPLAVAVVLQNAPQQAAGSFVVPRVIDA